MAFLRTYSCASILAHIVSTFAAKTASGCPASSVTPLVLTLGNTTIPVQDAFSYGVKVDIGNPKQRLTVMPSTVVDNTLLVSKDICSTETRNMSRAQCRSYHGGMFDITAAGSSFHNVSTRQLPADPGWILFNKAYDTAGETDLGLVSDVVLSNMTVAAITTGINFTAGHLGLGKHSVLLNQLKDAQLIPSLGFGLNAGSQSIDNPRKGNLVLGGYDSASAEGPTYTYKMTYPEMLADRPCPLQIQIKGLQLLLKGKDPIPLLEAADGHGACIEPYDNLFRLSNIGLERFQAVTGWVSSTYYDLDQLYVPEPGLMYPSQTGFNGSLKFFFDNDYSVEIPNSELQHPLRALDRNGDPVLQPNITQVNVYGGALGAWVLGKVFLSQVYLAVDYEAQQFQVADVKQNEVTASPVRFPSANDGCKKGSKLPVGSITAIVLGAVIFVALVAALLFCFCRRRNRKYLPKAQDSKHHSALLSDPHLSVAETSTVNGHPSTITGHQPDPSELPSDRRRSELDPANGVQAPPSPGPRNPPPLRIPALPRNHLTPYESVSPEVPPPQRATEPWNV